MDEIERGIEKVRRDAEGRLDKDNMLKSKMTRDHYFRLQPGKRLETCLPYEEGFQE